MQNGPSGQRNLVPATGALPAAECHQFISTAISTARTDEAVRPTAGGKVLLAGLLSGKLRLEFAQGFRKRRPRHFLVSCLTILAPSSLRCGPRVLSYGYGLFILERVVHYKHSLSMRRQLP